MRVGFPLNAAASVLFVVGLVLLFRGRSLLTLAAIAASVAFQAASLAALVVTRVDSLFGWSEPAWTPGAEQTLAVELAAIVALLALAGFHRLDRTHRSRVRDASTSRSSFPQRAVQEAS